MADRIPLVVDQSNFRIEEIPSGDNIDLNAVSLKNTTVTGVSTFSGNVVIGTASSVVVSLATSGSYITKNFANDTDEYVLTGLTTTGWNPYIQYRRSAGTDNRGWDIGIWDNNGVKDSWIVIKDQGKVGLQTDFPLERLHVGGNICVGLATTANYIAFYGVSGDGPVAAGATLGNPFTPFTHCFIGERMYDDSPIGSGNQRSELLIFKGDNRQYGEPGGPDRIRLQSGAISLCIYGNDTPHYGSFESVGIKTGIFALHINGLDSTGECKVGIGSTLAQGILDVRSTSSGMLPPRMTTAQRDAMTAVAGMMIYNTSTNKHQGYNGSTWNDFY